MADISINRSLPGRSKFTSIAKRLEVRLIIALFVAASLITGFSHQTAVANGEPLLPTSSVNSQASIVDLNSGAPEITNNDQITRASVYFIAARNASASEKARANLVCSGRRDNVTINSAMASNREIVLSSGTFNIGSNIDIRSKSAVTLTGSPAPKCSAMPPLPSSK